MSLHSHVTLRICGALFWSSQLRQLRLFEEWITVGRSLSVFISALQISLGGSLQRCSWPVLVSLKLSNCNSHWKLISTLISSLCKITASPTPLKTWSNKHCYVIVFCNPTCPPAHHPITKMIILKEKSNQWQNGDTVTTREGEWEITGDASKPLGTVTTVTISLPP